MSPKAKNVAVSLHEVQMGSASHAHCRCNGIVLTAVQKSKASAVERVVPLGFRDDEGTIVPYTEAETPRRSDRNAEAQYAGRPESVPMCIGQLVRPSPAFLRLHSDRSFGTGQE